MSGKRSPLDPWLAARMALPELGPENVAAWQLRELRGTLAWAREACPFHARRLDGLDLEALRSPADLALLPRMEPADLAAPGLLSVSQDEVARVVSLSTSGSSGPPKRLHFSGADLARTLDFFAVGMSTLCGPGDVALVLLPGRREQGVADLLARALPDIKARASCPPEGWTPADLPTLLNAEAVSVLVAAPTQLRALLAHAEASAACCLACRAVLASGEPLPPGLRAEVEAAWSCEVFDHWGMTETGYGGGVECSAHSGYHLREADLLVEVADPATGALLAPGEPGEILVTTLGPRALPLVRHRTGDVARLLPGPCPCGSPLRRLGPVHGRLAADALTPGTPNADGLRIVQPKKGRGRA